VTYDSNERNTYISAALTSEPEPEILDLFPSPTLLRIAQLLDVHPVAEMRYGPRVALKQRGYMPGKHDNVTCKMPNAEHEEQVVNAAADIATRLRKLCRRDASASRPISSAFAGRLEALLPERAQFPGSTSLA
jgi:hypothetical protein